MRIGVDLRVLASGRRTGIEEYTIGLLDALLALGKNHEWFLFYNAWSKPAFYLPWAELPWVRMVERSYPNRLLMLTAAYTTLPRANWFLGDLDLFFAPHFFPIGVSAKTKLVVTFHDLSFVRHPEFLSLKKLSWHALSAPHRQARRADHVITVSESSKADLTALYGISPERVSVIYSGLNPEFKYVDKSDPGLAAVKRKYRLPERFLLYFGTIEPRKNIIGIIRAFEHAARRGYEGALVIAGTWGWSWKSIRNQWQRSALKERIHFTGFVAPEDKPYLLSMAEVFVYPSFFEGFGFPPLEAMACGVPVITSRSSSLPEVVGDGALLVDPGRTDELVWAMETLLGDPRVRGELVRRGLERAKKFSWQRAALSTLQLFESVV